jgi:hypothetical protein
MDGKKNQKLLLAAAVVIILNFNSCSKYEDGPGFSLRTKTNRLTGDWDVVTIAGQNVALQGTFLSLEFEKDGDFTVRSSYMYYGQSYTYRSDGDWEWEDRKAEIEIELDGDRQDWEILRLTNEELWFEDEQGLEWKCEKD